MKSSDCAVQKEDWSSQNGITSIRWRINEAEERTRTVRSDIVSNVPLGTHFCMFYETRRDLIDVLVPYFKTGLENNQLCIWVTSKPLGVRNARALMREAMEDLDDYIGRGQMEIIDASQRYTPSGKFEPDRVLDGWIRKMDQAAEEGFDGLRVTGNTSWLKEKDWKEFTDYEATVKRSSMSTG